MDFLAVKFIISVIVCVNAVKDCEFFDEYSDMPQFFTCRITTCGSEVWKISSNEQVHTILMPSNCDCFILISTYFEHTERMMKTIFEYLYAIDLKMGEFFQNIPKNMTQQIGTEFNKLNGFVCFQIVRPYL